MLYSYILLGVYTCGLLTTSNKVSILIRRGYYWIELITGSSLLASEILKYYSKKIIFLMYM